MIAVKLGIIAILSYLLGSLNFGVILSNTVKKEDVRDSGSGNAGTTNMMRTYGKELSVVIGPTENIKITTPDDFYTFRALYDARENAQLNF